MWPLKTTAREAEIHWRWFQMAILMGSGPFKPFSVILGPKMAPMGYKITQYSPKWPICLEVDIWNHLYQIFACLMIVLRCHQRPVCKNFVFGPKNGSWLSQSDTKLPEMTWTHWNCHLKPSPMYFCFSCDRFEWSYHQFTIILTLGPKVAKNCRKKAKMTKIGLNAWKMTSKTISIGYLLLLRSFWVVAWPLYSNFEFGAKNGRKRPQMTKNGLNVWKVRAFLLKISWSPKPGWLQVVFSFWLWKVIGVLKIHPVHKEHQNTHTHTQGRHIYRFFLARFGQLG